MSLRAKNLSFAYGKRAIISRLNLELKRHEVVGVVGPNGAGKSTIIKLLTRLLKPQGGEVTLAGRALGRIGRLELARNIAVVAQGSELPGNFIAQDIVMMGRTPHLGFMRAESQSDADIVQRAMQRTDTWNFRERHMADLSGGERQRVLLARALTQEADYLLLDEPTNHLDLKYQAEVLRFVKLETFRGSGALVVLHDLNLAARVCDRVLLLDQGEVVAEGKPSEVFTETLIRRVYRTEADVFKQPDEDVPVIMPRL